MKQALATELNTQLIDRFIAAQVGPLRILQAMRRLDRVSVLCRETTGVLELQIAADKRIREILYQERRRFVFPAFLDNVRVVLMVEGKKIILKSPRQQRIDMLSEASAAEILHRESQPAIVLTLPSAGITPQVMLANEGMSRFALVSRYDYCQLPVRDDLSQLESKLLAAASDGFSPWLLDKHTEVSTQKVMPIRARLTTHNGLLAALIIYR
jgi:hypothetical protein